MKLAYIIGTYPSLTTTFIDREIRTLRAWNVEIQVVSLRRPASSPLPEHADRQPSISYLLPISPASVIVSQLRFAVTRPAAYFGTLLTLLGGRHPSLKAVGMTFLHFVEGVCVARLLEGHAYDHIHAHFMDRASTVALVAGRLLGVSYSLTAHAADIYVNPVLTEEKLSRAAFVATCTSYNRDHLVEMAKNGGSRKIKCIYHGLDLANYHPQKAAGLERPLILCVGQLKEKKGMTYLLAACRKMKDAGYKFDCQIVGDGPLHEALQAQIHALDLDDTVRLCGALPHSEVISKYAQASIFVLPAVVGADGDRDGIPNVILEAMAMRLPVVATRHSGIPEVVEDGINGLLVPPANAAALSEAIRCLLDDPAYASLLGRQGRKTVAEKFDLESNVARLLREFESAISEGLLRVSP